MKREELEKKITENLAGTIGFSYKEGLEELEENGKNPDEFDAKDFQRSMYFSKKTHFFLHPSSWIIGLFEIIQDRKEQEKIYDKIFISSWNIFAAKIN
jgi:hypothetical protein